MSKQTSYTPSETYNILKSIIESNDKIIASGGIPVSVSVIGERGIGKSTVQKELAADMDRGFMKVSLAQYTQPEELVGYYQKENLVTKGEEKVWIPENLVPQFIVDGFTYTGEGRTKPCPPDWVQGLKENSIIVLDDYSRGNQLFSQAIMELVNSQEMVGWDLKSKKVQILLNENPDSGEYNVNSQDSAQTDRMAKVHMIWDAKDWAARAEKIKLDEKLINFVLWAPELLENKKQDGISASNSVSPRMMDKFFSLVATIDDWEKHLDKISLFGEITVGKEVTSQMINFINKRLDKLPSVEKLIKEYDLTTAKSELTKCCGDYEKDQVTFKTATSAILTTRMYNYARFHNKDFSKDEIKKYLELTLHSSFTPDQKFMMVKNTVGLSNQFASICGSDPRFIKHMASK